jgi:hypothetical protein
VIHQFETIVRQDVEVIIPHPSEGDGIPILIPSGDAVEMAGCKLCSMVLEEAMTLPCPGVPIEEMMG